MFLHVSASSNKDFSLSAAGEFVLCSSREECVARDLQSIRCISEADNAEESCRIQIKNLPNHMNYPMVKKFLQK